MTYRQVATRYPGTPIEAYYIRRHSSLRGVLEEFSSRGLRRHDLSTKAFRQKAVRVIKQALGARGTDYAAARAALANWCSSVSGWAPEGRNKSPEMATAYDLEKYILPVIQAFENPRDYFTSVAPARHPLSFGLESESEDEDPPGLCEILTTWGPGALLNPDIYEALVAEAPVVQNTALDILEPDRRIRHIGRRPSDAEFARADRKHHGDTELMARDLSIKIESVDRRIRRNKERRRRK